MREFKLSLFEWSKLSRVDKKILFYFRAMEGHYFDIEKSRAEQKAKMDQARRKLPHVRKYRGRY